MRPTDKTPLLETVSAGRAEPTDPWKQDLRSPLDHANWLSQLTLWWVNPAVGRGYKQSLEEDDVWELPAVDQSESLQKRFDASFAEHRGRHRPSSHGPTKPMSIWPALWKSTNETMGLAIVLHVLSAGAILLQPLLIKAVLQYVKREHNIFGVDSGYGLAAMLAVAAFVGVTALDYGIQLTMRSGMSARLIVINAVYQKLLRLTTAARQSMSSGDVITLTGVDSERVYDAYATGLWSVLSPVLALSLCILIGIEMGALVGLAASLCCACVLWYAVANAREIGLVRRQILEVAGERVKVTNEVVQGIRVFKMYAWESSMAERIAEIREREIQLVRKYDYLRVTNMVVLTLAQTYMTAACLVVYVFYQGNELTVATAFTLLACTNACRMPFGRFSNAVVATAEAVASIQRISAFLAADERSAQPVERRIDGQPIIELVRADFGWAAKPGAGKDEAVARPVLRNINLSVLPGSLTIVVGTVGSGKSSLVSALLDEMEQLRGTRSVRGAVAYASQQAWIQHNTVRENILFGAPYDATFYNQVVAACQLTRDFEILEAGDATEIGERGVNLSGGQKARVSLARATYRRGADLVVLDDPLSALDVHVANAVFFECVKGLAASKTRLLVLNAHYHLAKHADRILVMSDGELVGDGSYDEVRATFKFLDDQASEMAMVGVTRDGDDDKVPRNVEPPLHGAKSTTPGLEDVNANGFEVKERVSVPPRESQTSRLPRSREPVQQAEGHRSRLAGEPAKKATIVGEDRAAGAITWRTYATFLACCGYNGTFLFVTLLVLFAMGQFGMLGSDYFLTYWSTGSMNHFSQEAVLWMYVGVVIVATGVCVLRAVVFIEICIRASKVILMRFLRKVLMAPVNTFFDVTPIGRVLNRFSRDLDQIDNPLPLFALGLLIFSMQSLSIFVVCAVTTPAALIFYPPMLYASYFVQKYYLASSRELKRLDGTTRSPFLSLVTETIHGIETVRSFDMADQFSRKCRDLLDHNAKFFFMFQTTTVWFSMRLDWLVTSLIIVVSFACIAARDSIGSANAGIALTYVVQLSMTFQRTISLISTTENNMTSFERIAHYGTLEEEGHTKPVNDTTPPPPSWPSRGTIEFNNVYLRYRDGLDFVLHGVTFRVRDGEKIGVCGRTGSGKSTLVNVLFRTVEATRGTVLIDDVDIATIKLQHLRSKLTIIPQDPVLFSGTLRDNLDPFGENSDEELFSALRKVHLIDDVSRWGHGLSYEVSEKGENLSVGQRQLVCIARALLRESRIVVLDEATASVDHELDRLIQLAVKECFRGRTSLTIAHRLETIIDSDRILVMDQGRVAEFDSPANLLARRDGLFASLMKSTAPREGP